MAKILIDTNVFIKKLRMPQKQVKELLETLLKEKDSYCFTEQNIDEFFRNINKEAINFKNEFSNKKNKNINTMQYDFGNEKDNEKYKSLQEDIKNMIEQYYQEKEKEIDCVTNELKKFFEKLKNEKFYIINRTNDIIYKANNRHLLGNPPGTDKVTIGDEIIWESILQELKEDLIIVSNDNSFIENEDFLKREFDDGHRKLLGIVKDVEQARKMINLPKDENLEKIENKEKEIEQQNYNNWLNDLAEVIQPMANMANDITKAIQPQILQYQMIANYLAEEIKPAINVANNIAKAIQPQILQYQKIANYLAEELRASILQYLNTAGDLANVMPNTELQCPKIDLPQTSNEKNNGVTKND